MNNITIIDDNGNTYQGKTYDLKVLLFVVDHLYYLQQAHINATPEWVEWHLKVINKFILDSTNKFEVFEPLSNTWCGCDYDPNVDPMS